MQLIGEVFYTISCVIHNLVIQTTKHQHCCKNDDIFITSYLWLRK